MVGDREPAAGHLLAGPLVLPTDFALHLAMSPDGELLAVSALDEVFILDARTLDEITRLPVSVAIGLRFSPDRSTLLVASGTTETRVYRTDDWSFEQIGAFSVAVDFNSTGERFVTLDADRNIRLWEMEGSGVGIAQTIPVERMHLRSYANTPRGFSRFVDDAHIATVDSGVVSVYTTDIDELFSIAADRLTRALTEAEYQTQR